MADSRKAFEASCVEVWEDCRGDSNVCLDIFAAWSARAVRHGVLAGKHTKVRCASGLEVQEGTLTHCFFRYFALTCMLCLLR